MALGNMIPVSVLFRREAWVSVGYFRPSMSLGWDDWDFWLSLIEYEQKVHQFQGEVLDLRVKKYSHNRGWSLHQRRLAVELLVQNHSAFFASYGAVLLDWVSYLVHQR